MTKDGINKSNLASQYRTSRQVMAIELLPGKKLDKKEASAMLNFKRVSALHFFQGLKQMGSELSKIKPELIHWLPTNVMGTLLQPDGTPARDIIVNVAQPPSLKDIIWGEPSTVTDIHGAFVLKLPSGIQMPSDRTLRFSFRGRNAEVSRDIKIGSSSHAMLDEIWLEKKIDPLPKSIISSLASILGWISDISPETLEPETKLPDMQIKLGEMENSLLVFKADTSRDQFRFDLLIRLVEPRLNVLRWSWWLGAFGEFVSVGQENGFKAWFGTEPEGVITSFSDRVPIDRPLDIDEFRDDLIGDKGVGVIVNTRETPMAATLGLGYVVRMAQHWTPAGLSLGNLIYSLPLAPGEQQRLAVFEQVQSVAVREKEALDIEEQQSFAQLNDTSTQAVFESAFSESSRGSSHYDTRAHSGSSGFAAGIGGGIIGGFFGLFGGAGGGKSSGSSNASGDSSQTLDGARNYVSSAAEDMHSSVQRQASARRRAQRTGMRLATSSDIETAVTKVITNNNRTRALTIQYWEVLRNFDVTTSVDGVTLVCFIPLEVIRFLPDGQSIMLGTSQISEREDVLNRYSQIAKHVDILRRRVPPDLRQGVDLLNEFISNPEAKVAGPNDLAENIVNVTVSANVLPCETIYVSLTTRNGGKFGPVPLAGEVGQLGDYLYKHELIAALHQRRDNKSNAIHLEARFALPEWFALHEITGIELTRTFSYFSYQLRIPGLPSDLIEAGSKGGFFNSAFYQTYLNDITNGVHLDPAILEAEFGGPLVKDIQATLQTKSGNASPPIINEAEEVVLPATAYPIAALHQVPVLKYSDLLKIEKLLQHVVRDPVTYSKFVWQSLTAEERAIMLEGYTIGVPSDGDADESQNVPLLNCVANQVLGFYGNAMVMPFSIPPDLAGMLTDRSSSEKKVPITTGIIQNALTEFHRKAFSPPRSHITIPTRGVLGEAVLGTSPSAEKIDLTRFWNWQDSPIPQASEISPISLNRGSSLISGLEGPKALTGLSPMIANINATPASEGGELVKALIAGANTKDIPDITGSKELAELVSKNLATSESARADALAKASSLASDALKTTPDLLKSNFEHKVSLEKINADKTVALEKSDVEKMVAKEKIAAENKAAQEKIDAQKKEKEDVERKEREKTELENRKQLYLDLQAHADDYIKIADKYSPVEAAKFADTMIAASTVGMPVNWIGLLKLSFQNKECPNGTKAFQDAIDKILTKG
jgi:hypothetical protein